MIAVEKLHPWYRARFNFVKVLLESKSSNNMRILDFGCGSGEVLSECVRRGFLNVKGVDTSIDCIESVLAKGINCELLTKDTPFLDEKYDLILCLDVLEHLENDSLYLELFKNALLEKGKILITVPAHPFLWSPHDVFNHHYRRYTRKSLILLIKNSGLHLESIRYWNSLLFPIFLFLRPLSRILKRSGSSEFTLPPKIFRPLLYSLLAFESKSKIMGAMPGVSLIAVLNKAAK
jgi:2-polyprenyl-3-methyl-5-hydroxy-6-metoxy-1,4-benzoquinol methylase